MMGETLDWSDIEGIALELYEQDVSTNPLTLNFTQLRDRILNLGNWSGGGKENFNEKKLEAVQMAWLEEFRDHQ
jgi:FeS assembly protein IscX